MTNEEAFRKWRTDYESDYDKKPSYLEVWQAAISYMQEQSEPVAYGVMMPDGRIDKSDEPFYFADEIERKLANCIDGCTIAKFYATPQRQQPLKRLSDEKIIEIWESKRWGHECNFANAIMDAMQEINK